MKYTNLKPVQNCPGFIFCTLHAILPQVLHLQKCVFFFDLQDSLVLLDHGVKRGHRDLMERTEDWALKG